MESQRKIMILLIASVFTGLVVSPALGRRYDTHMIGYDRWIDINYGDQPGEPNELYFSEGEPNTPACLQYRHDLVYYHDNAPNTVGNENDEPNELAPYHYSMDLAYYHDNAPNSVFYHEEEPNMVYYPPFEPNSVSYYDDPNSLTKNILEPVEPNIVLFYNGDVPDNPEEPNTVSTYKEDPNNNTGTIILDEGTASMPDPNLPKFS